MNNLNQVTRRLPVIASLLLFSICLYYCKPDEPVPGTVNIRMEAAAKNLNPYLTTLGYDIFIAGRIFQSLGGIHPETFALEPMLLKKIPEIYTVADGPRKGELTADFDILDEAVWDNGSPVTAKDVLFSLKVIFHPTLPTQLYRGYFEYVKALEADPANPKKFKIYFKQYYILAMESVCQVPIYPAYNYDPQNLLENISLYDLMDTTKIKALAQNPNLQAFATEFTNPKFSNDKTAISGSGPYRLESMGEQLLTLVKKDNWWGDALAGKYSQLVAYPKLLNYKIVKADDVIENMLKTEELDVAVAVNATKFNEWKQDDTLSAKYDFKTKWILNYNRWQFNLENPKLSDKRVRQALAYAVDYDYLIKTVVQGFGQRLAGPINPSAAYYAKDIVLYNLNIQKARALLAEAGWTDTDRNGYVDKMINGKKTDLEISMLSTNSAKTSELISTSIQQSAMQAGIKIGIISVDISELRARTIAGDFESALYGGAMYPGLVDFYQNFYSGSLAPAGDNRTRFSNSRADSLILAIRTTENEAKRNAFYVEMQQILHDEVPEVYLYAPEQRYVISKKFDYVISSNRPGYYEQMFKKRK